MPLLLLDPMRASTIVIYRRRLKTGLPGPQPQPFVPAGTSSEHVESLAAHCRASKAPLFALSFFLGVGVARTEESRRAKRAIMEGIHD